MQSSSSHTSSPEVIEFNRPPRKYPYLLDEEISIPPPPSLDTSPRRFNILMVVTPALFLAASSMTFLFSPTAGSSSNSPWIYIGAMITVTVFTAVLNYIFEGRIRVQDDQRKIDSYQLLLDEQESRIEYLQNEREKNERNNNDLSPDDIFKLIGTEVYLAPNDAFLRKLWQRRIDDSDCLRVRIGVGRQPSSLRITAPPPSSSPVVTSQPQKTGNTTTSLTLYKKAQDLAAKYKDIDNVPVVVDLRDVGSVGIDGGPRLSGDLLRAILCHLVFHHAPDEVRIAVALHLPKSEAEDWYWLRSLPHTQPLAQDGSAPMVADTAEATETMFNSLVRDLSRRDASLQGQGSDQAPKQQGAHLILILIGHNQLPDHPVTGLILRRNIAIRSNIICLVDSSLNIPGECGATIEVAGLGANYEIARPGGIRGNCQQADKASIANCRKLAMQLQRLRLRASAGVGDLPMHAGLVELLNIKSLTEYRPADFWDRSPFPSLSTPLGIQSSGALLFDLKAHGPHGLIAGTTGAGKSELLKTLILGLAMTQSPHDLTFLLIDYKGGGGLGVLASLPHCVGLITNLQGRLAERALQTFDAELKRRQQRFAETRVENIDDYNAKCEISHRLPRLMIVIDEFAQLVSSLSNFMDRLISISQTGRSLGVHLLLATQRPAGVVSPAISANTNYRICLRVQSIDESRDVIGRPDAALIPSSRPGRAYFQVGQDLITFQTARISNRFVGDLPQGLVWKTTNDTSNSLDQAASPSIPAENGLEILTIRDQNRQAKVDPAEVPLDATEADVVSHLLRTYVQNQFERSSGPWSEPLPEQVGIPQVFAIDASLRKLKTAVFAQSAGQWAWPTLTHDNWLRASIGLVDDLRSETKQPLVLDFSQEPHVLIAGSSGSGKSTAIRTLVTALTLTHNPLYLSVYLIDFGGQSLQSLSALPHVGKKGVFTPSQPDRVRRLIRWLMQEVEERQQLLGETDTATLWELNEKLSADGKECRPALLVVIDNFASFRSMFEDESNTFSLLARNGRKTGIHLVLTTDRPVAVPGALLSNIEIRLALRLNDSTDAYAMVNHPAPSLIEAEQYGRGFRAGRPMLEFQIALPATTSNDALQTRAVQAYAHIIDQAWTGVRSRVIDPLPKEVRLSQLHLSTKPWRDVRGQVVAKPLSSRIIIGQDDQTEDLLSYDPSHDGTHLLIIGSPRTGKSMLLRVIINELCRDDAVDIAIIDPRRSLRDLTTAHIFGYADRQDKISELVEKLQNEYNARRSLRDQEQRDNPTDARLSIRLGKPIAVIIDDLQRMPESVDLTTKLAAIANDSSDLAIYFFATCVAEDVSLHYSNKLLSLLQASRTGVVLRLNDHNLSSALGVTLQRMRADDYPPGRGLLVTPHGTRLMQIAKSEVDQKL